MGFELLSYVRTCSKEGCNSLLDAAALLGRQLRTTALTSALFERPDISLQQEFLHGSLSLQNLPIQEKNYEWTAREI